jgi:hypothetical protein
MNLMPQSCFTTYAGDNARPRAVGNAIRVEVAFERLPVTGASD